MQLTSSATLTGPNEPGEPMEITGTVYQADGRTPSDAAVLFVYHTDATGHYSANDDPFAPRLRGWVRTGPDGRYSFRSIRPAPYPNRRAPAHIHVHIWSETIPEHSPPEFWFEGDPLLKNEDTERFRGLGSFSPVIRLTRDEKGVWRGRRDFRITEADGVSR